jgi:hypothetical protein
MSKMDGLPGNRSEHVGFVAKNDYNLFRRGRERYCKIGSGEGASPQGWTFFEPICLVPDPVRWIIQARNEIIFKKFLNMVFFMVLLHAPTRIALILQDIL